MDALILAAGYGSRLREVSDSKPLAPIAGVPLLELGVRQGWDRYIGTVGAMIGVDRFGASAPAEVLLEKYGFTVDNVVARARELLRI